MAALRRSSDENFSAGKYYDAQQDAKTLYRRLCAKAQYAEAMKFCVEQAVRFTAASEYELAIDLGKDLVSSLSLRKEPPSEENLSALEAILGSLPQRTASSPKYALINQALKWSAAFTEYGHPRLHKVAAMSHWADGAYGKCQGHYVYCGEGAGLAKMVREWQQQGYAIERDLFSLRVLLILLSLPNNQPTARSFWDAVTEGDVPNFKSEEAVSENTEAPIPEPVLQCGTFLLAAVESRSIKFFQIVRGKYALVIRRDRTFDKYLDEIESNVLGSRVPQSGIGALFELLLGSGGGGSAHA